MASFTGEHGEAEQIHRKVLEAIRRLLGPGDELTLASMNNLANALHAQGKRCGQQVSSSCVIACAEPVRQKPSTHFRAPFTGLWASPASLTTVILQCCCGFVHRQTWPGRADTPQGASMLHEMQRMLGPEHPHTLACISCRYQPVVRLLVQMPALDQLCNCLPVP